jgi:hypothetical protein
MIIWQLGGLQKCLFRIEYLIMGMAQEINQLSLLMLPESDSVQKSLQPGL